MAEHTGLTVRRRQEEDADPSPIAAVVVILVWFLLVWALAVYFPGLFAGMTGVAG